MRFGLSLFLLLGLAGAGPALAQDCLVLMQPLAAGEYLHRGMTAEASCEDATADLPLRFDRRARAPIATEPVPSGTYLGPLKLLPKRVLAAGEPLMLVFRQGPVAVEREAVLLLPTRAGEAAVARTTDGSVLSLPLMLSDERGTE